MSEYNKAHRERVSVKVDVLRGLKTMIQQECYEQAVAIIDVLLDPTEREKKRKKSAALYLRTQEATTKDEKDKAWRTYIKYLNDSII